MRTVTAKNNRLMFAGAKPTTVKAWGDYHQKIKWKLEDHAKNRGYILQIVSFEHEIRWVETGELLANEEVFGCDDPWAHYSELWLVSAGHNAPASTLNQDHFRFESIEGTYGYMKETGLACFFESAQSPEDLGFGVHDTCPAGIHMPSMRGGFDPGALPKTPMIKHLVHVSWDKVGKAKVVKEIP